MILEERSKNIRSFRRGIFDTLIGFLHTLFGMITTIWAVARIAVIGWKEPMAYSTAIALFNYSYEASSLLLWMSGIGILRAKRWGEIAGAIWAALTIFFHIASHYIKKGYWFELTPGINVGEWILILYCSIFIAVVIIKNIYFNKQDSSDISKISFFTKIFKRLRNILPS